MPTSDSSRPRRICFVTIEFPPDWGGVSKSAGRLVDMLADMGLEVDVFAPTLGNGSITQVRENVALHRVPVDGGYSPAKGFSDSANQAFVEAIATLDDARPFALFHGYYLPSALPCMIVAEKGERPVIASIRGDDAVTLLSSRRDAMAQVLQGATWITSVSSDGLARAAKLADIAGKSSFIPNSIRPAGQTAWALADDLKGVVGTVCTFRPKKNIPLLIDAYARLPEARRRKLLLVGDFVTGDDATRVAVDAALDRNGVRSETRFPGYVANEDIAAYLAAMHVFVLPSAHEGFPNTLLEAASVGVPIVASAVDGIKDVVGNTWNALLVPPNDTVALAHAIERVLADTDLAHALSTGAQRIAQAFSHEREARCWAELYASLLNGRSRSASP